MATKTWAVNADAVGATDGGSYYGGDCDHLPVGYMSWLGGASRAFLKFTLDWSGVVQITKAELHIRTTTGYHGSIGGSTTAYVDLVTSSWAEGAHGGSETWFLNDQPSYAESVSTSYRASFTPRADSTWYTVDITAIANRWAPASVKQSNGSAGAAATNYGIRIISSNEGASANRTEFHAREAGSSDAYVVLTYSTNQAPTVTAMTSPVGGVTITDDTPNLVFTLDDPDAADTVTAYDIQVDDQSDFSSPFVNLADQAIGSPANTVQVTHTCAALARNKTWYWRARGKDNQGLKAVSWGSTGQFFLASLPVLDTLSPTGGGYATIHNLGDLATWADGSYAKPRLSFHYTNSSGLAATKYRIRVYDAATNGNLVADSNDVTGSWANGSTIQHNLATAMPRGTNRWWTVQAWDSAGGDSTESARQQFQVQWGQAIYEANPGAGASAWQFTLGAVGGGSVVTLFRTATQSGSGGSFGTTSAWNANIANLTPAAFLNVLVRLAPTSPGVNVTLGSMALTYQGSGSTPDHWTCSPTNDWVLSTAQRRFGAKSLKCTRGTDMVNRYIYPYTTAPGADIPAIPGVVYTLSGYVNTPAALTGGYLRMAVYQGGSLSVQVDSPAWSQYVLKTTDYTNDTTGQPDGWQRLTMTFVCPPGWTTIRPMVHYVTQAAVAETWYVDGVKLEEGPVATPWQAGALGAVILDSGGVSVDQAAGGSFRLRGGGGTARDVIELSDHGLVFGTDVELTSPNTDYLNDSAGLLVNMGSQATVGNAVLAVKGSQAGHTADYILMAYENATLGGVLQFGVGDASGNRDVNLYRVAANNLATDDLFSAFGGLQLSSGRVLRYVPLETQFAAVNISTSTSVAWTNTAEITAIPAGAVAVAVRFAVRNSTVTTAPRCQVGDYGTTGALMQAEALPGAVANQYDGATAHYVRTGGTNNRQFAYTLTCSGTLTGTIYVIGYWTDT